MITASAYSPYPTQRTLMPTKSPHFGGSDRIVKLFSLKEEVEANLLTWLRNNGLEDVELGAYTVVRPNETTTYTVFYVGEHPPAEDVENVRLTKLPRSGIEGAYEWIKEALNGKS